MAYCNLLNVAIISTLVIVCNCFSYTFNLQKSTEASSALYSSCQLNVSAWIEPFQGAPQALKRNLSASSSAATLYNSKTLRVTSYQDGEEYPTGITIEQTTQGVKTQIQFSQWKPVSIPDSFPLCSESVNLAKKDITNQKINGYSCYRKRNWIYQGDMGVIEWTFEFNDGSSLIYQYLGLSEQGGSPKFMLSVPSNLASESGPSMCKGEKDDSASPFPPA